MCKNGNQGGKHQKNPRGGYSLFDRPHKGGNFYPKTPTISAYKRINPEKLVEWGHGAKKLMSKPQAAKDHIILSNFKLQLDETLHPRGFLAENKK